jgi:VanZ family protein
MSIIFLRAVAWSLLTGIVVMTVVPPGLRVVTGAPHAVEHTVIFLATGVAFGLAYELRLSVICATAIVFCASLEILQLAIPGRHARVSDFFVDFLSACMGIAIAWTVRRLSEANRADERSSTALSLRYDATALAQVSEPNLVPLNKQSLEAKDR